MVGNPKSYGLEQQKWISVSCSVPNASCLGALLIFIQGSMLIKVPSENVSVVAKSEKTCSESFSSESTHTISAQIPLTKEATWPLVTRERVNKWS